MGRTVTEQILADHLLAGELRQGQEIALRIDQTLTQDATGTLAYLEFEAIGLSLKGELLWSYALPKGLHPQPIEQVGARLRAMMPFLDAVTIEPEAAGIPAARMNAG